MELGSNLRQESRQRALRLRRRCYLVRSTVGLIVLFAAMPVCAQINVSLNVNTSIAKAALPDGGLALHTSVYTNNFTNSSLDNRIQEAGIEMLRYPGGSYSDFYHWSVPPQAPYYRNYGTLLTDLPAANVPHPFTPGTEPTVNPPWPYAYYAGGASFPNFIRLVDNTDADHAQAGSGRNTQAMITVNYGSSLGNLDPQGVWRSTKGGQPQEAAAWVAYSNSDPSIYGTPNDVPIGADAEGINWRTAGYWAKLRASTASEYQTWATADGVYDSVNSFLAMNHDAPVGIQYWEIGNEIGGNGYTGTQWEFDLHAPYANGNSSSNVGRQGNPLLSPTAYANNTLGFVTAMKAVDPAIKIGVGLDMGSSTANQQILSVVQENIDFGIVHWYPGGSNNANTNASQVLNATDNLPSSLTTLRNQINTVVGSNDYEIHMTEFGYFGAGLAAGLDGVFAANSYATALEEGVKSAHWLEMSKNSFLGDGTPTPGSGYYGIQVMSQVAQPGATFLATSDNSSGDNDVETHATLLADGSIGLLIVNLGVDVTRNANVSVNLTAPALYDFGTQWLYGVNQLTPLQSTVSDLGNHFTINVPYRSVVALLLSPRLLGDYNDDGIVGAADYTVWRNSFGQAGDDLAADETGPSGVPDGVVDNLDYGLWKEHFGESSGAGTASIAPEPSCAGMFYACLVTAGLFVRGAVYSKCCARLSVGSRRFFVTCVIIPRDHLSATVLPLRTSVKYHQKLLW